MIATSPTVGRARSIPLAPHITSAATRSRRRKLVVAACALLTAAASACSSGADAVSSGGSFEFVSPGGKTTILYDPPSSRGRVADLVGESLAEPGQQLRLSDYAGQVVVLNVWGSWCGPCRTEAPELERAFENTRELGVQFLGVNVRDNARGAAQDFVTNYGVSFPSFYDPPGRVLLALKGFPRNVVPSTIVLDRQHRVAAIYLIAVLESDVRPVIERIAAEEPASASEVPKVPVSRGPSVDATEGR